MLVEYSCIQCGKHVQKIRTPANMPKLPRFCSQKCNGTYKHAKAKGTQPNIEFDCVVCGKHVKTYRSPVAQMNNQPKYCSPQCTGAAQRGQGNPAWAGGRRKLNTGYILIFAPEHPFADTNGLILEHRMVMECTIGRHLTEEEVVHHINSIKDDNRPENLRLFPNQAAHMRYHMSKGVKNAR